MAFAWGCYPGFFINHDGGSKPSKKKKRRSSRHKLVHSASGDFHRDTALGLCERLKEELTLCQSNTLAKERLKEKSKFLMPLLRQLESILLGEAEANTSEQETELVHTYPKLLTTEQLAVQLVKKDDEIQFLKEQCEKKAQQIKQFEEQRYSDREQAKEFEINYRVEAEENQWLRTENEELKNQLDSGFGGGSDDECDLVTGAEAFEVKKTVTGLKARVKDLNEDVVKLRNHSKEQSRQILKYKQQVEVSNMMEGQLESMERIQHEAKEECHQMHKKLKSTTHELRRLKDEKEEMERERTQLERNLISMSDLSSQLMEVEKTTAHLKQQLQTKECEVTMLKAQLSVYRVDVHQGREVPVRAGAQSKVSELEKNDGHAKGRVKLGRAANDREYEDLEHNYQSVCKQLEEHRESLSVMEQVNATLKQEVGARSSQVKHYAKEVDRLKRQLEALTSTQVQTKTDHHGSQIKFSKMEELYQTAQGDIEYLSGANAQCYQLMEQLEKENAQLKSLIHKHGISAPFTTVSEHDEGYVDTLKPLQQADSHLSPLEDQAHVPHPVSPFTGQNHSQGSTLGDYLTAGASDDIERDNPGSRKTQQVCENQTTLPPVYPNTHPSLNARENESKNIASNALEDSVTLFENPLQRELDDEIHQQAAQVIQEVSGSRREVNTDLKRPFDPNLVCPMCRKQFRIGEIQRYRRHVNTCTGTSDV